MKLFLSLIFAFFLAHLTSAAPPVGAAVDAIECPHGSTVAVDLSAKLQVHFDPIKCETSPDMEKFLQAQLKHHVFGPTRRVGATELDFRQVCENTDGGDGNTGGNNLRHSRKLQWNWTYSSEGECRFCSPEDDDDFRLLVEGEGGRHIGGIDGGTITELEDLLSTMLTNQAAKTFTEDKESCLFGESIEISVLLTDPSPTDCGN